MKHSFYDEDLEVTGDKKRWQHEKLIFKLNLLKLKLLVT